MKTMTEIQNELAIVRYEAFQKAKRDYEETVDLAAKRRAEAERLAEDAYIKAWKAAYSTFNP